ncbi:MAG: hypothetical protein ABIJ47_01230 [Candidatus Bathyarchaeota archaeon]
MKLKSPVNLLGEEEYSQEKALETMMSAEGSPSTLFKLMRIEPGPLPPAWPSMECVTVKLLSELASMSQSFSFSESPKPTSVTGFKLGTRCSKPGRCLNQAGGTLLPPTSQSFTGWFSVNIGPMKAKRKKKKIKPMPSSPFLFCL